MVREIHFPPTNVDKTVQIPRTREQVMEVFREIRFPPTIVDKKVQIPWTKELVMEVFKSFDKDGDGRLSKEELKASFKKLGSRWSSFRAWRALRHADANKDGFISMEEIDELLSYALKHEYKL